MNPWFASQAQKLFFRSLRNLRCGFLEIVCPEETYSFGDPAAPLRAMAVVHDPQFFVRALSGADIGIGESYMAGDWTSPDLVALVRLCVRNVRLLDANNKFFSGIRALAARLRHRLRSNTLKGSRKNISAHYDLGNDFYELMLDESMLYSCAHFENSEDALHLAQKRKLELICGKLKIVPGDSILEIGCGWGAFAMHAAQRYGAHVTAVTISQAQFEYAAALLARTDVRPGSVKLLLQDYRHLQGQFDKIVSIEMFEAVGFANYDKYFSACDRLLKPDGAMLLQTITLPEQEVRAYRQRTDWIQTYIFPGSELASVSRNNPLAGPHHPVGSDAYRNPGPPLRTDLGRLAPALLSKFRRSTTAGLRRTLHPYVGFLSRLVRRSLPRALHQSGANCAGETRHATPTARRSRRRPGTRARHAATLSRKSTTSSCSCETQGAALVWS